MIDWAHRRLRLTSNIWDRLLDDARGSNNRESCGLLSGRDFTIKNFYPTKNASPTPTTSYEIAPPDLFRIMREIRKNNLELIAIYHSHPTTESTPSPTDIARAYYPEAAYIIVSPQSREPIRAFQIRDSQVTELAIEILEDEI
jgi:[CysO sulfur-carrier protein]-S-L-cysteine hydrolase